MFATPVPKPMVPLPPDERELQSRLKWLMFFRLLMISVFLGATLVFSPDDLGSFDSHRPIFYLTLIVGVYALTLVYALLIRHLRSLTMLAHAQLTGDVFLSGALVWATGGSESIFSILFSLAIINGAIILYRKGALVTAASASLVFVALMATQGGPWPALYPSFGDAEPVTSGKLYYVTFVHVSSFFLVAVLAGRLSEMLRAAGSRIRAQSRDLKRYRALNANIVNSMPGGLITIDEGRIIFVNPCAERILGVSEAELMYRSFVEVFGVKIDLLGEERPLWTDDRVLTPSPELPGESSSPEVSELPGEIDFERGDGQHIRLSYQVSALRAPGDPRSGQLVVFEDVTRIRMLEESMRRSQHLAAIGELAAGIAHEVRNPLASISGAAQMLSGAAGMDEEDQTLLEILRRETDRLERLITDFLSYARPSRMVRQTVHLGELIAMNRRIFCTDPVWEGVDFPDPKLSGEFPISGDPDQLNQVLWNLVSNAVQATKGRPEPRVSLSCARVPAPSGDGEFVELVVEDNGKGMDERVRARMFDPFYTTRPKGTGLGLAIVNRIVEEHQGLITVQSVPDQGTRVIVLLPAAPDEAPGEES